MVCCMGTISNGRAECYAVCPGIPDLAERERQDAMPAGLYRRFVDDGVLLIDEGLRMSRPETLVNHLVQLGIRPEAVTAIGSSSGRYWTPSPGAGRSCPA